ncbi:MAG TPA: ParB N-terminal domain-containing protein [Acidimicrobiia bacterium]|nr:ParB N-terminal domain-containing protein [Acidimicrobiia bacterium]
MSHKPRYRHLGSQPGVIVRLRTDLVARYRAVDREVVPAPSDVVDTPAHLDHLAESIAANGIRVPLRMGFNTRYGYLDGNHRIAVALRLGLPEVPVELVEEPLDAAHGHGQPMRSDDLDVILAAIERRGPS